MYVYKYILCYNIAIYKVNINIYILKEMQLPDFILISTYCRYSFPENLPNHSVVSLAGS